MPKRPAFHGEEPLQVLVKAAAKSHLAEVYYRKGVTRAKLSPRTVEPYSMSQGKQDALVRCYQREPQEGWRFFMIHKLDQVKDTGIAFKPRAKITLTTAKFTRRSEPAPGWTPALKQYRNLVGDALADGVVTRDELREIGELKRAKGVTVEQIRFVHASIFHRCLATVLEDGVIDDDERRQIRFLNKVLSRLGWTIGE